MDCLLVGMMLHHLDCCWLSGVGGDYGGGAVQCFVGRVVVLMMCVCAVMMDLKD